VSEKAVLLDEFNVQPDHFHLVVSTPQKFPFTQELPTTENKKHIGVITFGLAVILLNTVGMDEELKSVKAMPEFFVLKQIDFLERWSFNLNFLS